MCKQATTSNSCPKCVVAYNSSDMSSGHVHFGDTYIKIGTIQRRLAWPLRKDDTQIREAFHIFPYGKMTRSSVAR